MAKYHSGHAGLPREVKIKSYEKKGSAINEDSYVDTQEQLDKEFNKAIGVVRKIKRK